jgi:enoyl-CoA hydratase/carnithine racemase
MSPMASSTSHAGNLMKDTYADVAVQLENHVALVEIQRPPHNFFDHDLIANLADAFEDCDREPECRALVLAAQGKSFCAGADFQSRGTDQGGAAPLSANPLYIEAVRLFSCKKPVIGAIQGAAVGGGLGLALVPDFRVGCPESRFSANFVKLGIHPGFALTHTLPRLIGQQRAALMFYTGRRIGGEQALAWGLIDEITTREEVRNQALTLAGEIAEGAPLAVQSTRTTLRQDLAQRAKDQTDHELAEQTKLFATHDHKEGIQAVMERRPGKFTGR